VEGGDRRSVVAPVGFAALEIVSPPLTEQAGYEQIKKVCKALELMAGASSHLRASCPHRSWQRERCGAAPSRRALRGQRTRCGRAVATFAPGRQQLLLPLNQEQPKVGEPSASEHRRPDC